MTFEGQHLQILHAVVTAKNQRNTVIDFSADKCGARMQFFNLDGSTARACLHQPYGATTT
jgi:hypothetical protein